MPRDLRQPFEITLRLVLVRLVFYAALVLSMLVVLERKYFLLIFTVFMIIHHVYTSIAPRSFSLPRIADLVLTIFEATGLVLPYLAVFNKWVAPIVNKWMARAAFLSVFVQWALFSFLVISAGTKFWDIIKYGPMDRYDIRRTRSPRHLSHPGTLHLVRDIFLGRAPWEAQFTGEPKWIILSRGMLAAGIIIVVIIFACYNMVLETLRQVALTPINDLRGYYAPSDFTITTPVWNVILTRLTDGRDSVDFGSAFQVRPLRTLEDDDNPCSLVPELESTDITTELSNIEHVAFHCPSRIPIRTGELLNSAVVSQDIMPDLLITVNFTLLNISSTAVDTPTNSVQLMIGLTNETYKVFLTTMPTTLIPGVNLFGLIRLHIRQTMSSSVLAVIGLFDLHETFLVSSIDTVWPDPRASASDSVIPKAPDIATIRLTRQIDDSEWHIIQDRLDKSVVRGLASSGGLWTALGGILSIFFGSSIMRIMFDSKPFSMFGLAHKVQSPRIRRACVDEYPRILDDVNGIQARDRGLTSLMCDHLIDVDHLVEPDDPVNLPLLPVGGAHNITNMPQHNIGVHTS